VSVLLKTPGQKVALIDIRPLELVFLLLWDRSLGPSLSGKVHSYVVLRIRYKIAQKMPVKH
jgi:hypothetical protein